MHIIYNNIKANATISAIISFFVILIIFLFFIYLSIIIPIIVKYTSPKIFKYLDDSLKNITGSSHIKNKVRFAKKPIAVFSSLSFFILSKT